MSHPSLRHACVAAMFAAASASPVMAQDPADPRTTARVHIGPFYFTPRVALEELGVDTNVFRTTNARQDLTMTLVPQVDLWVPIARRALITTTGTTRLVYYRTFESQRSVDPGVQVRGDLYVGRFTPFAAVAYVQTNERPNLEFDVRSAHTDHTVRGGLGVRLGTKLNLELARSQSHSHYDADATLLTFNLREVMEQTTNRTSLALRHTTTPFTMLVAGAEFDETRFPLSPIRDSHTLRVTSGIELKPGALVSGAASVGVRWFTPEGELVEPFTGVVAAAALRYTMFGRTRFSFNGQRDLTYSYELRQPYFIATGYGLEVRQQLIGRTDVTGGFARDSYAYRDLLLPDELPLGDRVDVTHTWMLSFGYRIRGTTRIGLAGLYRERRSTTLPARDFEGLRVMTTIDLER